MRLVHDALPVTLAFVLAGHPSFAASNDQKGTLIRESVAENEVVTLRNLYDCALPLRDSYTQGLDWSLGMRILPAWDSVPEWSLKLARRSFNGPLEGKVIVPVGGRIAQTLLRLEARNGEVTCGKLRAAVTLRQCDVNSKDVAGLLTPAGGLGEQRWPAMPSTVLVFDATMYEVRIDTIAEHLVLSVQGPSDRRPTKRSHPFIRWAEEAFSALAPSCGPR